MARTRACARGTAPRAEAGRRAAPGLPDLDRAIEAYRLGRAAYFHVPDTDARSIGAKLVTQIVWYGSVRTPFTFDFARESLQRAGFVDVTRQAFGRTGTSLAGITDLDNRERESLFVEALRARDLAPPR